VKEGKFLMYDSDATSAIQQQKGIDCSYFLSSEQKFPWDWYFGRPSYGDLLGHGLRYLALVEQNSAIKSYLSGKPTLSEIERLPAEILRGDLAWLVSLHNRREEAWQSDRELLSVALLKFIKQVRPFVDLFTKQIYHKFYNGSVLLPEECFISVTLWEYQKDRFPWKYR
jgi:hypothetical protein